MPEALKKVAIVPRLRICRSGTKSTWSGHRHASFGGQEKPALTPNGWSLQSSQAQCIPSRGIGRVWALCGLPNATEPHGLRLPVVVPC